MPVIRAMAGAVLAFLLSLIPGANAAAGGSPEENLEAGLVFLEENSVKPDVVTTASGLQYLVLVAGTGPKPRNTDRVLVNYRGTLLDGTEFDSSQRRGEPASFSLGDVIPGWREALELMPVGSTWRLFIHPALAYAERGTGMMIGPNATLVFEVELLALEP